MKLIWWASEGARRARKRRYHGRFTVFRVAIWMALGIGILGAILEVGSR